MGTLATLGQVQLRWAQAFPDKFAANPVRALALRPVRTRNTTLDAMYYNIDILTRSEGDRLAENVAREGAVLWVPPSGGGETIIFPDATTFLGEGVGEIGALAMSGVGSSAVGSAAFARDVANALGKPVIAVVSGYGFADVAAEAVGGFFLFGALNGIRHIFEPLDAVSKAFAATEHSVEELSGVAWVRASGDTRRLVELLMAKDLSIPLLIGHSKGNLVISEALYAIQGIDKQRTDELAETTRIVTISAKIAMPSNYRRVLDIMGQWDSFGALNSRLDLRTDVLVPGAGHSTNPDAAFGAGIDVTATLKWALPNFDALTRGPQSLLFSSGDRAA